MSNESPLKNNKPNAEPSPAEEGHDQVEEDLRRAQAVSGDTIKQILQERLTPNSSEAEIQEVYEQIIDKIKERGLIELPDGGISSTEEFDDSDQEVLKALKLYLDDYFEQVDLAEEEGGVNNSEADQSPEQKGSKVSQNDSNIDSGMEEGGAETDLPQGVAGLVELADELGIQKFPEINKSDSLNELLNLWRERDRKKEDFDDGKYYKWRDTLHFEMEKLARKHILDPDGNRGSIEKILNFPDFFRVVDDAAQIVAAFNSKNSEVKQKREELAGKYKTLNQAMKKALDWKSRRRQISRTDKDTGESEMFYISGVNVPAHEVALKNAETGERSPEPLVEFIEKQRDYDFPGFVYGLSSDRELSKEFKKIWLDASQQDKLVAYWARKIAEHEKRQGHEKPAGIKQETWQKSIERLEEEMGAIDNNQTLQGKLESLSEQLYKKAETKDDLHVLRRVAISPKARRELQKAVDDLGYHRQKLEAYSEVREVRGGERLVTVEDKDGKRWHIGDINPLHNQVNVYAADGDERGGTVPLITKAGEPFMDRFTPLSKDEIEADRSEGSDDVRTLEGLSQDEILTKEQVKQVVRSGKNPDAIIAELISHDAIFFADNPNKGALKDVSEGSWYLVLQGDGSWSYVNADTGESEHGFDTDQGLIDRMQEWISKLSSHRSGTSVDAGQQETGSEAGSEIGLENNELLTVDSVSSKIEEMIDQGLDRAEIYENLWATAKQEEEFPIIDEQGNHDGWYRRHQEKTLENDNGYRWYKHYQKNESRSNFGYPEKRATLKEGKDTERMAFYKFFTDEVDKYIEQVNRDESDEANEPSDQSISDAEWRRFQEEGNIPGKHLDRIAGKLHRNESLTEREKEVAKSRKSTVDQLASILAKSETEKVSEVNQKNLKIGKQIKWVSPYPDSPGLQTGKIRGITNKNGERSVKIKGRDEPISADYIVSVEGSSSNQGRGKEEVGESAAKERSDERSDSFEQKQGNIIIPAGRPMSRFDIKEKLQEDVSEENILKTVQERGLFLDMDDSGNVSGCFAQTGDNTWVQFADFQSVKQYREEEGGVEPKEAGLSWLDVKRRVDENIEITKQGLEKQEDQDELHLPPEQIKTTIDDDEGEVYTGRLQMRRILEDNNGNLSDAVDEILTKTAVYLDEENVVAIKQHDGMWVSVDFSDDANREPIKSYEPAEIRNQFERIVSEIDIYSESSEGTENAEPDTEKEDISVGDMVMLTNESGANRWGEAKKVTVVEKNSSLFPSGLGVSVEGVKGEAYDLDNIKIVDKAKSYESQKEGISSERVDGFEEAELMPSTPEVVGRLVEFTEGSQSVYERILTAIDESRDELGGIKKLQNDGLSNPLKTARDTLTGYRSGVVSFADKLHDTNYFSRDALERLRGDLIETYNVFCAGTDFLQEHEKLSEDDFDDAIDNIDYVLDKQRKTRIG